MRTRNAAPFPYPGSKQKIAARVWRHLGDVKTYVEPFAGSCAVLLNRPHKGARCEIINDLDGAVVNFWRALKADPGALWAAMDSPPSSIDLEARGRWLIANPLDPDRLRADPDRYSLRHAAWWAWRACTSINPLRAVGALNIGPGRLSHRGGALHPERGRACLEALADRLRGVAILCGDWRASVTDARLKCASRFTAGVFLDPPYDNARRAAGLYAEDDGAVARRVRAWCLEQSARPWLRLVLCGYGDEHSELELAGWSAFNWSGGHGALGGRGERVWVSPSCVGRVPRQASLFEAPGQM